MRRLSLLFVVAASLLGFNTRADDFVLHEGGYAHLHVSSSGTVTFDADLEVWVEEPGGYTVYVIVGLEIDGVGVAANHEEDETTGDPGYIPTAEIISRDPDHPTLIPISYTGTLSPGTHTIKYVVLSEFDFFGDIFGFVPGISGFTQTVTVP